MSTLTEKPNAALIGCRTDVGKVRKMNQDSFASVGPHEFLGRIDGLFVVADGMGGKAGGEIASRVTVETVPSVVMEAIADEVGEISDNELGAILQEAISSANEVVYTQARANPELKGMGTTCVAVLLNGKRAIIGHVGDSRIYLCRSSSIEQVTEDHSLVQEHVRSGEISAEEAKTSRYKNMITRAIGIASAVAPDIRAIELLPGDRLLLCSDGLTNMVTDAHIAAIVDQSATPQAACDSLVEVALNNGGDDNVTVLIVQVEGDIPPSSGSRNSKIGTPINSRMLSDQPEYLANVQTHSPARRSRINPLLLLSTLGLCVVVYYLLQRDYTFSSASPFIKHNVVKRPTPIPSAPKPDLTHLAYADPVSVSPKRLRGAPLACDGFGNLYGVTRETGAPVKIKPDGSVTLLVASETTTEGPQPAKHWAVDYQGNLYVSSRKDKIVNKYDANGTRVGSFGSGFLNGPEAIAVDSGGNIFVVDSDKLMVMRAKTPQSAIPGAGNGSR